MGRYLIRTISNRPSVYLFTAAAALIFLCCATAACAAAFRHDLTVELDLQSHKLIGLDVIRIDGMPPGEMAFLLAENARIGSVMVNEAAARYSFRSGILTIPPGRLSPGKPVAVRIAFEAAFNDPVPSDPASFDNPGFGVEGTISDKGVFLLPDSGWYPRIEGANSFKIKVIAPRGVYAVTAGELIGHRDEHDKSISSWKVEGLALGPALSAAKYSIRSGKPGRAPVYTYFFPEPGSPAGAASSLDGRAAPTLSETYIEAATSHLKFYEDLHGPYAFPKFAVVENFFPTGYGFPSYTLLGSQVLRLPFIPRTSLRHEIAHCWWGNGVPVDYESGNWSEGLTTYVADYLSLEIASADEAQNYRRRILRDYATLAAPHGDIPLARFLGRTDPAGRAVGYGKAAFLFHMIRQKVGDESFWRSLRIIYAKRFQVKTSWEDFRKVFVAEGGWDERESKLFFDQWIARGGAPKLKLGDVSAQKSGAGWEVRGAVVQDPPFFDLDAKLRLAASAGGSIDSRVKISGASSPFALHSDGAPEKLALDPEAEVFRLLYPEEIPATVNSVKSSDGLVAILGAGTSAEAAGAFKILLAGLNHSGTRIVREQDVDLREISDRDVLFFGFPQSDRLRDLFASAPPGLKVSADEFALDGSFSSDTADNLFIVFNDPARDGKLTALFHALPGTNADSITAAARKITHYGQYSYLAFSRGTNQAKGTWEASRSPLIVDFKQKGD
ncbi:MAG: hypothetical protein WAW37_11465 [Syntrophobacteraceae bacterium]